MTVFFRRRNPLWGDWWRGWLHADWLALLIEVALVACGIAFIYGTGLETSGALAAKWSRQLAWAFLGAVLYFCTASVDYRFWARHGWLLYLCGLTLLLWVLLFGRTLNGTRGWLKVPGVGFLQPVELAKPATLLLMSWLGTRPSLRHSRLGEWMQPMLVLLVVVVPVALICLEPDAGTAMVFLPVALTLVFLTGLRLRWFVFGGLALVCLVPTAYSRMKPYQQARVKVFAGGPAKGLAAAVIPFLPKEMGRRAEASLEEFLKMPAGGKHDDWNAVQSLLAVGSGGLRGKGYLNGRQHRLGYLPRTIAPTDFIFSVIAEETGFVGAGTLLALLVTLFLLFLRTALSARDRLGAFLACGVVVFFATHALINVAMTIQVAPIVGLPLPFVSYGGSFMMGTMLLAGLVQSVHIHSRLPSALQRMEDEEGETAEDEEESAALRGYAGA